MGEQLDPYRVLGLPVGADEAAVRRRYRALVRKHHPDVSADSEKAHERFVRIQEAYRLLMDPERREWWERRAGIAPTEAVRIEVTRTETRFDDLLAQARTLLSQRRFKRAHETAAEAIELNPFSPEAFKLMGDIYLAARRNEMAFEMYDEAKRLDTRPRARRVNPSDPVPGAPGPVVAVPPRRAARWGVLAVGLTGTAVCLGGMALLGFAARPWSFAAWGVAAAFLLASAGTASGVLEPLDDLLGVASVSEPGRAATPGAVYLVVLSTISPYLGLLYYAWTSAATGTHAWSIIKVYAATFVLALFAWLVGGDGTPRALMLFAPSIAFAALLTGWAAGSFASPHEWWRR
jgi:curved DNA-binding protein CbpA